MSPFRFPRNLASLLIASELPPAMPPTQCFIKPRSHNFFPVRLAINGARHFISSSGTSPNSKMKDNNF